MAVRRGSRRPKTYDEMCEGIPDYSLFILGKRNPIRAATISLVKGPLLRPIHPPVDLANCVFLAMDTSEVLFEESSLGKLVAMSEAIFTGIYVVEMILKIIAMGFVLGGYLSDPWNRLDFFDGYRTVGIPAGHGKLNQDGANIASAANDHRREGHATARGYPARSLPMLLTF